MLSLGGVSVKNWLIYFGSNDLKYKKVMEVAFLFANLLRQLKRVILYNANTI